MSVLSAMNPLNLICRAAAAIPALADGLSTNGRPSHDFVGNTLFADNARIIFVNGVGSREQHCRDKARLISRIFDGSRVDYIYIPITFGDAHRAITRHTEPAGSTLLLHTIRGLYQDLQDKHLPPSCLPSHRVLSNGERIICIVHSGGGGTLESIKDQIPPHILDRMDIVSIGSAQVFDNHEFRNIRNFVAKNDPIPFVCTALSGNFRALMHEDTHFISPRRGEGPITSHQFASSTYRPAIEQVRDEYVTEIEPA